jgi:hypothetical protein
MPEQASRRANAVTTSPFENPFQNQIIRFGVKGLNLKDSLDVLEGWSRHTNLDHDNTGEATTRAGQTGFAGAGSVHHSVRKLRNPNTGADTRIWGIDASLYYGVSGVLASADSGYSGHPLALVPHRPPLSGEPWMYVGDSSRMRKIKGDGTDQQIGLPAPTVVPGIALATEKRTTIAACDASDGTNAAAWTMVAGEDTEGTPTGVPAIADDAAPTTGAIAITVDPGSATEAFDSWGGVPISADLTLVGGAPASDDDVIHLWMKTSHPHHIEEVRVYFVIDAAFDPANLPGMEDGNENAYVKGFRQNDFVQFVQTTQTQIEAAETARIFAVRDRDLKTRETGDTRPSWREQRAKVDPIRDASKQIGAGAHEWFEMGSIGLSLRRGDFKRIGSDSTRDWATVTGMILYIASKEGALLVGFGGVYLTGGSGPDTMEPGAQPYDYVYTHYDPTTGAEGNSSPVMADPIANGQDALRRGIIVTPTANGSSASIRQRIYRRGGSLVEDHFFVGTNTSDGGAFTDSETDDGIAAAGTVPIDHFQPVPTVDSNGNTVLAQPIYALWGPLEGMLFGCGDPFRPGHLYYSIPDQPEHWSASGNTEVCPPSEQLMNGGIVGSQGFVFSRARLYATYPNLTGIAGTVTATPTLCKRGLKGRWAMVVGPGGIFFVAEDGVFLTTGGPEEWISRDIDPLFHGETVHGYLPIDLTVETALRLTIWENKLYFGYQDTSGARQVLVYSLLNQFWRHYKFGRAQACLQGEDEDILLIGGLNTGHTYLHSGITDDGVAIPWSVRTGAISGGTREEKLFGDQFLDVDRGGDPLTVQNFLDEESAANNVQTITTDAGRQRHILDAFGDGPQKAHSLSVEVRGSASHGTPILYQTGVAITLQPDLTTRRVTNWDDLGASDEVWLSGVTFDCDTEGLAKQVLIERDYNGVRSIVDTLTVTANGRHKVSFSWDAVPARMVRVHPDSEICQFWLLYRADWIWVAEPPRISKWDIHFENAWDQYYTGLDLYCDTAGLEKRIEVYVDNVRLTNDLAGGLTYWPVVANGRKVVHLTLPWGRGHVFRFRAIDTNKGLLYQHRWHLQEEPSEQANWNQNFSILGSRADKYLKAVIFECDTFGANKQVQIEADGASVETITVNTNGRKVVQRALTVQQLGRVWRMFPVDGNPGRLYSAQPVFDEEPFCLDRWETQETSHNLPTWFAPLYGYIVLKASFPVTLTLVLQHNQPRALGGPKFTSTSYTIPSTGGVKMSHFQSFQAGKGCLIRYILTSVQPFWLYREETTVVIQPWGADQPLTVHPFGNSGEDPTRGMINTVLAAGRDGGGAS